MPAAASDSGPEGAVVEVLGVRFHPLSRAEAAAAVAALAGGEGKGYVVKLYSECMARAARDAGLRQILNGAGLRLADGVGIVWAAHYLSLPGGPLRALLQLPLSLAALAANRRAVRGPVAEAMAGVDFTWEMLARLEETRARVFFLGGTEEELRGAVERVRARLPGLEIAGSRNGYFDVAGEENEAVVRAVNEARADVLVVAMGFPRQEEWIAANLSRLNVRVAVAEGGSLSFMSGAVRRAPRRLRDLGLEWLFRLLRQPWRLRRQLSLPLFVMMVVGQRLRGGRGAA